MKLPNIVEARSRDKREYKTINYNIDDQYIDKYKGKKLYIKTYGCQMNERDSETIIGILGVMGISKVDNYRDADICILNTCSIRENANNKAFGMLGRLKYYKEQERPDLVIGICGCMVQEEEVATNLANNYKFVDLVFGTHNIEDVLKLVDNVFTNRERNIEVYSRESDLVEGLPVIRSSKYKAYVNIIYGCDKFCTYCIVPYTRGRERSRSKNDILEEVKLLIKDGYKEITLLGQNVNAYGKDLYDDYNLGNLLEDIAKLNIPRIRFMTSHPWDFTDNMISVIKKYDNIMPSVHLPLQSGSNKILRLMGRRYTKESYLELFNKIKNTKKNMCISTDIIVGFPGEDEEDFLETLDIVKSCRYDNVFSFIFSARRGTPACRLKNIVNDDIKEDRLQRLNDIVNTIFREKNEELRGVILPVLVEGVNDKKNMYYGYSDTNKLINFTSDSDISIGDIVDVKIVDPKTWSLDGKRVE